MNVLKRKLNNQKGASITWALLIFLVCAVVGSAVLVAGTAAAGRMSKLADSEQRYYAVTSAAGLLRDALKDPITVTRTAAYDDDGNPQSYSISYGSTPDVIMKALVRELMDWPEESGETPYPPDKGDFWTKDSYHANNITATFSFENAPNVSSAVEGLEIKPLIIGSDGSIVTELSKDGYSLQLVFDLKRTVTAPQSSDKTIVKSDEFQWVLKEARKVESNAG